jgi:hypothetical protein
MSGEWAITAPELAEDLELGDTALTMRVKLSNNPLHTRVCRQLYAFFNWGRALSGTMRFALEEKLAGSGLDTLKDFEKVCVLETGCWPNPGETKWVMRYRARYPGGWTGKEGCDEHQTKVGLRKARTANLG